MHGRRGDEATTAASCVWRPAHQTRAHLVELEHGQRLDVELSGQRLQLLQAGVKLGKHLRGGSMRCAFSGTRAQGRPGLCAAGSLATCMQERKQAGAMPLLAASPSLGAAQPARPQMAQSCGTCHTLHAAARDKRARVHVKTLRCAADTAATTDASTACTTRVHPQQRSNACCRHSHGAMKSTTTGLSPAAACSKRRVCLRGDKRDVLTAHVAATAAAGQRSAGTPACVTARAAHP
jgi:hypothetical protein